MSGTSLDGIDAALVDISDDQVKLIDAFTAPLPEQVRREIAELNSPTQSELHRTACLDQILGELFSDAVLKLLSNAAIPAENIVAIGSHGQTLRHNPNHSPGYSIQVGDPNTIAERTAITTVCDFRRRDIVLGGQGAPLIPLFHEHILIKGDSNSVVVNIGGMSNLSYLDSNGELCGHDSGPGNVLINYWISQHQGTHYDDKGAWAASGNISEELLAQLMSHDFFALPTPKSTGREQFNPEWLAQQLKQFYSAQTELPAEDIQATLTELTARSIAEEIRKLGQKNRIICCGGGSHNHFMMSRIHKHLPNAEVFQSDQVGIPADWIEAMGFAWFAFRTLHGLPTSLASVTGARKDSICGGIYPGTLKTRRTN